jgi:hypothetical protein
LQKNLLQKTTKLLNKPNYKTRLHNSRSTLFFDESLNLQNKTIINKDEDIFASVVNHYSIDQLGEEAESSDKKEVEEVDIIEALRCIKTVKI